jgi:hypothetical protein
MTDDLVAMLRKCEYVGRESGADFVGITSADARKAADRIEALEAERDELREALIRIAVEEKAKLIYERMP